MVYKFYLKHFWLKEFGKQRAFSHVKLLRPPIYHVQISIKKSENIFKQVFRNRLQIHLETKFNFAETSIFKTIFTLIIYCFTN